MKWSDATQLVGLPYGFEIITKDDVLLAHEHWRIAIEDARRNEDHKRAAVLSQVNELFKAESAKFARRSCECGRRKSGKAEKCIRCLRLDRFKTKSQEVRDDAQEVRDDVLIPPKGRRGGAAVYLKLKGLRAIGQSVDLEINGAREIVYHWAKRCGIKIEVRQINGDPKKLTVWRTDGKNLYEVNDIIEKRSASALVKL